MFAVSVFPSTSFPPLPSLSSPRRLPLLLSFSLSCSHLSLLFLFFRSIRKSSPLPKLLSQWSRLLLLLQLLPPLPPPLLPRTLLCRTSLLPLLLLLRLPLLLPESLFLSTARRRSVRLHLSFLSSFNASSSTLLLSLPLLEPSALTSYFSIVVVTVSGEQLQSAIANMIDMGFEREQVMKALRASFNNPDRAVEYLMSVSSSVQLPLSDQLF